MRCSAFLLPSDAYRRAEAQILQELREGDRATLLELVRDHDLEIELLGGEWRLLFETCADFYQTVDEDRGLARMTVSPEELAEFVAILRDPERSERWQPIAFGLRELTDALPIGADLVGLVFLEEPDDWMWSDPVDEIIALAPEVHALLAPVLERLLRAKHFGAAARIAEDHSDSALEFSAEKWRLFLEQSQSHVPELLAVLDGHLSRAIDYTAIRESLARLADPRDQPSLDAWLRVHTAADGYVLFFRDANLERRARAGELPTRLAEATPPSPTGPSAPAPTPPVHEADADDPPQAHETAASAGQTALVDRTASADLDDDDDDDDTLRRPVVAWRFTDRETEDTRAKMEAELPVVADDDDLSDRETIEWAKA